MTLPEQRFRQIFRALYPSLSLPMLLVLYKTMRQRISYRKLSWSYGNEKKTLKTRATSRLSSIVLSILVRSMSLSTAPLSNNHADSVKKVTQFKLDYYDPEANDVMGYIEGLETRKQINDAIGELPAKCREVFILSYQHDKKNKEIAEQLGISIRTVEVHLYKALKTLRTRLKRHT